MHTHKNSEQGTSSVLSDAPWGSKDKALIIEDNEGIAGLLTILLGKSGLKAILTKTGGEGLQKFDENRDSIALVVSDCRLPDGDGREICQQMREQSPDLPLLLSSGSAACLNLGPLRSGRLVRFLPKPYSPAEMLGQVGKLQAEVKQAATAISAGFV